MPTLEEIQLFAKHHLKRRVVDHPAPDTQMGGVSLGYDAEVFASDMRALGDRFAVSTPITLAYRGAVHPVFDVEARDRDAPKRVLVLGGVHGNEQAGILAVPRILEAYDASRQRYRGRMDLRVLAPVNPVGAAFFSRFNADGYDVNRDFVRFETREARLVRDVISEYRPDIVVALHEGPQDATFMFTNQHVELPRAARLLRAMEKAGTELARQDYFGRTLRPPGLAPMSRPQ